MKVRDIVKKIHLGRFDCDLVTVTSTGAMCKILEHTEFYNRICIANYMEHPIMDYNVEQIVFVEKCMYLHLRKKRGPKA